MSIDKMSRVEDILHATLGDISESELQPPQSRVEALLQRLEDKIDEISEGGGKLPIHICTSSEYNPLTGIPTIQNPVEDTFYLVPDGTGNNLYTEWIYTNGVWDYVGGSNSTGGDGSVHYDIVQSLSDGDKARARLNISAAEAQEVSDLKSQVDNTTILINGIDSNIEYPYDKDKYCNYTAPLTKVNGTNWECVIVKCKEGDVFNVKGYGGSVSKLWIFSDSSGSAITYSANGVHTNDYARIVAPQNAAYLTCNSQYSQIAGGLIRGELLPYITPQAYGAKADGVNDDSSAIKSAITYSLTYGGGVYFPPGNYKITEKISFGDLNAIVMDSKAKLVAGATVEYMVDISVGGYPTQRPFIKNIRLDGNETAQNGIFISGISNSGCVDIAGLIVENCIETGIEFSNCQGGLFEGIKADNNGGDGIQIAGCNNAKFVSISALANGGNGIVFSHGLTSASSGACFLYGVHSENNAGYGLNFETGGLYSLYSGWLEVNKSTALYISSNAKCNLYGFKVVHGDTRYWAEIYSDYVTIKDCDIQIGTNAQFEPLIASDYAIIENLCRAVQTGVVATGETIAEKLFANVIPNGDMQGDQSTGAFNVYYGTKEYQNTDVVEQGKTYSLKSVSTDGNFAIRKDGVSGWIVGALYKITFRVYLDGDDCNMRVTATDQTLSNTQYGNITDIKNGQWNEVVGYFYARSSGEIRIGAGMSTISSSAGASLYISEFFCQQCVEKNKISNKRIGKNKVYMTIEPPIMQ